MAPMTVEALANLIATEVAWWGMSGLDNIRRMVVKAGVTDRTDMDLLEAIGVAEQHGWLETCDRMPGRWVADRKTLQRELGDVAANLGR